MSTGSAEQLRATLRGGARGVAASPELWERTQRRVAERRRRRLVLSAAAAAVVLLAVPVVAGFLAPGGDVRFTDQPAGSTAASPPVPPEDASAPPGSRESASDATIRHLGLVIEVPEGWRVVHADRLTDEERARECAADGPRLLLGRVSASVCPLGGQGSLDQVVVAPLWDASALVSELSGLRHEGAVDTGELSGLATLETALPAGALARVPAPLDARVRTVVVPALHVALEGPQEMLDRLLPGLRLDTREPTAAGPPPLAGEYGGVLFLADGTEVAGWTSAVTVPDAPPLRSRVSPASTPEHTVVATLERAPGLTPGGGVADGDPILQQADLVVRSGEAVDGGAAEAWRVELPGVVSEDAAWAPAPVWSPDGRSLAWLASGPGSGPQLTVATWGGDGPITGAPDALQHTPLDLQDVELPPEADAGGRDPATLALAVVGWWTADAGGVEIDIGFVARQGTPVGAPRLRVPAWPRADGTWEVEPEG